MKMQDVRRYFRDSQVSLTKKSLAFFAVAYGVMPFDLVSDFIPVIGWLDDVGVIGVIATYIWRDVKKHAAREQLALTNPPR
jgi:uncharacterized membrane protein YkvA (DUF1232 family)